MAEKKKKPTTRRPDDTRTDEERARAAERFVWRPGDIRWIVPPGQNRRDRNEKK